MKYSPFASAALLVLVCCRGAVGAVSPDMQSPAPQAAPSTQESDQPSTSPLELRVQIADKRVADRLSADVAAVKASEAYIAAAAAVNDAKAKLDDARANGSAQDKLDASSAFNRARATTQRIYDDSLRADPVLRQARAEDGNARAALAEANKEHQEQIEAQTLREDEARDALNRIATYEHFVEMGFIGKLGGARIVSVVGPQDAIVTVTRYPEIHFDPKHPEYTGASPPQEHEDATVWVSGVDTSTWTSDSMVDIEAPVEIKDTKTYDTAAGGTQTILHAQAIDVKKYLQEHAAPH